MTAGTFTCLRKAQRWFSELPLKPKHLDRAFVIGSAAALVAWMGCITLVWARAMDASGGAILLTLSATMLSLWFAVRLPGKAARFMQRLLSWLKVHETLAVELAAASMPRVGTREARALLRLLGAMTILAVAGALVSTAVAYWIGGLIDWLARWFVLGRWGWLVARFCVQLLAMLPMSLGICVVFFAGALVRRGSGRDIYATICRDWTWAIALGLTALGVAWWLGLSLLGLPVLVGALLIISSVALLQRKKVSLRPPPPTARPEQAGSQRSLAWSIRGVFAAMAVSFVIQMRLLSDVAGVGLEGRMCWAGLSVSLLAGFLGIVDHKSSAPGRAQGLGAIIGITAGLGLQVALVISCLLSPNIAAVSAVLAVLAQIPLMAMAAVLLSRQRRNFARMGAGARTYVSQICLGLGLGFLACLAAGLLPEGRAVMLLSAIAVLAAAPIYGIAITRLTKRQVLWALWGAVLLCSLTVTVLASLVAIRDGGRAISPGVWLSAMRTGSDSSAPMRYLPLRDPWRSDWVRRRQDAIIASHPGLWWVVASSPQDVPQGLHRSVRVALSSPDPSALHLSPSAWGVRQTRPDKFGFLLTAQIAPERFDGVLLAPMEADHLQAWRVYNLTTLRRCFRHVHPGGAMLLRTQASGRRLFEAIRVARTFHSAVGSGWFIAQFNRDRIDLLLAGPVENVSRPPIRPGTLVIRLKNLWSGELDCRAIRILQPAGFSRRSIRPWALLLTLQDIQRRQRAQDDGS